MSRFTKALRQKIVRDFAVRHGGRYDPTVFVEEVRSSGTSHPAYEWFEWDVSKAAHQHQLDQARNFARDLRVTFTVTEIGARRSIKVRETAMPLLLSPMSGRKDGGGYVLVDTDDPSFMIEHCLQAATTLRAWLSRYRAALDHAGTPASDIETIIARLGAIIPQEIAA